MPLKEIAETISNFASALGIVGAGLWVLFNFGIKRERHAKIEFELDLNVLGRQFDSLLVEVIAKVTNKGLVRHWLYDFRFDLLYLPKDMPLKLGDKLINEQVLFLPVIKKRYWIPPYWTCTFIDPGVCQHYTYLASAPANAKFLLVYAQFKYPDTESDFHTAQKTWAIDQIANTKLTEKT
jgi:hypothetical protein